MEVKDCRCTICDTVGNWENVDELATHKKNGMHICLTCGFVFYPALYKTESEIKEYYREEYRPAPNVGNLFSGQRKIHYHEYFLRDMLDDWTKKKAKPVVAELGAAYGLVLKWMKGLFPEGEYSGSEMTLSYRRVAWHENQIKLDEELDLTKKYDLLISYKVHEHLMDSDKKLREMALALKDDGLMYISVPCWFNQMYNFGASGFDLDYYYSTNHIDVWTRELFEVMLKKCGLEIVKQDHAIYDSTYLCKRNDKMMDEKPKYHDAEDIKDAMSKIKSASMAFDKRDYRGAIEIWGNYPTAWQAYYENTRGTWHKKGYEVIVKEIIEPMLKSCPNTSAVLCIAADISMRYSNWDEAIGYLKRGLEMKPQNPEILMNMSHCFRHMAKLDDENSLAYLNQAMDLVKYTKEVSLQTRDEAINWLYKDASELPLPSELNN